MRCENPQDYANKYYVIITEHIILKLLHGDIPYNYVSTYMFGFAVSLGLTNILPIEKCILFGSEHFTVTRAFSTIIKNMYVVCVRFIKLHLLLCSQALVIGFNFICISEWVVFISEKFKLLIDDAPVIISTLPNVV